MESATQEATRRSGSGVVSSRSGIDETMKYGGGRLGVVASLTHASSASRATSIVGGRVCDSTKSSRKGGH